MRGLKVLLTSLTILVVFCTPTLVQSSSPSASQYAGGGSCSYSPNVACAQSVEGGAEAFAENAGKGTDAVNEAIDEADSSASASASSEDAASPESSASAESAPAGDESGRASAAGDAEGDERALTSLTELPETGGAPAAVLGTGALLVAIGLAIRRF